MAIDMSKIAGAVDKYKANSNGLSVPKNSANGSVPNSAGQSNPTNIEPSNNESTASDLNQNQNGTNNNEPSTGGQPNGNTSNNNGNNNQGGNGEQPQKTKEEEDAENNKKALDAAAEIAEKTGNPYAVAAAKIYKGANALTGGKAGEKMGKTMSKINKIAPGGKDVQDLTNALGKSGTSDAVKNGVGATNGGGAASAAEAANDLSNDSPEKEQGKKELKKTITRIVLKRMWPILLPSIGSLFGIILFILIVCPTGGGFSSATEEYGSDPSQVEGQNGGENGNEGDLDERAQYDQNIHVDPASSEFLANILSIARGELGVLEGSTRWKIYDENGSWCAAFVEWVLKQAGWDKYTSHSCNNWRNWFKNQGKYGAYGSYSPKAGDLVFYDGNGDGVSDHIGIVTSVGNDVIYTIEGNTNDPTGVASTHGVFAKTKYGKSHIAGFGVL